MPTSPTPSTTTAARPSWWSCPNTAALALLALRGLEPHRTRRALDRWADLLVATHRDDAQFGTHHITQFLSYMLLVNPTPPEDLRMAIDHHLPRARGQLKTAGEQLLEQGRNEGLQEGRSKGRVEGLVEGRVEGLVEGRVEVLRRLLTRRFGPLPAELEHQLVSATQQQLDRWTDRILDADSLAGVFAAGS